MVKYLVVLESKEEITTEGWKEMFNLVNKEGKNVNNVYKMLKEDEKEVCDWIQGRLDVFKNGKKPAKKVEKSREQKAFEILKKNGEVKIKNDETGKETYEALKAICKKNNVASTGRFCKTYYKVTLK